MGCQNAGKQGSAAGGRGGGEGQRTKMRTSLYTAPAAAAATCPSPRMEIAAQLCLPLIESVTLHLDRLFELKNDSLCSLEGFFSPRQVAHEGPMDASCLILGFSEMKAQGFLPRRGFDPTHAQQCVFAVHHPNLHPQIIFENCFTNH